MQHIEWRGTWQSPMVRKQGGRGKRCKCHLLGGVANQGREWQKDKKEPSQNLQAPPPCTLDPGFAITLVPDGPTSWVFASAFDDDASCKQRQGGHPGERRRRKKMLGLVFRRRPLLNVFQLPYRCRLGHCKTLLSRTSPHHPAPPRVLREWW